MNDSNQIAPLHEAVIGYLCRVFIEDDSVLRKLRNYEDESLNDDDVAALLRCSVDTLKRMIDRGEWQMVKGPNGKYQMTRKQFREQQALLLQFKKQRR